MIRITPKTQESSFVKLAALAKNRVKIAAGGNVPSNKPKYAKALTGESGFCISVASSRSCSLR